MTNYKTKTCLRCGEKYMPTNYNQKYCPDCKVAARQEYTKQWSKQWYKDNKEQRKEYHKQYSKQYYLDHTEQLKEQNKQWKKDNLEYHKQWRKNNPEYEKQWQKDNPEKAGAINRRQHAKRRKLGYIPLNKPFEGSVAHHMNKEFVMHIPEELHKSISHNVWTGQGMAEINFKVLEFLDV